MSGDMSGVHGVGSARLQIVRGIFVMVHPQTDDVSRIYSTTLLILLQHPVLQYFLLYIEQKLYGPLWVPLVLYSYLVMIS